MKLFTDAFLCIVFCSALGACHPGNLASEAISDDGSHDSDTLVDGNLYDPNTADDRANNSIAYLGGAGGCTATLIAPQVLLTAGHCAPDPDGVGQEYLVGFPAPLSAAKDSLYRATHTLGKYPVFLTVAHERVAHPEWKGCVGEFKYVDVGTQFATQCADGTQSARGKLYLEDLCDSMRSGTSGNTRLAGRAACETSANGRLTDDGITCALLGFSIMLQPVNRDAYRGINDKATFEATYAHDMLALRNAIIPNRDDLVHAESVTCSMGDGSIARVGYDIALIKLDAPMPSDVNPERVLSQCSAERVVANTPVLVFGFGATVTDILWRLKFPSELNPIEDEKPFGLYTGLGLVDSVSEHLLAIQGGRFYNMPGQCPGDSGSPVMMAASGGKRRAIAGVTSTSRELDGFCLLGADYTRVQTHSGWIKNTVANFRDAALKEDPANAAAIQRAFALDTEACCGDGFVDSGERCDGNCPTSCDDHDIKTKDALVDVGTCQARCVYMTIESVRSESDGSESVGSGSVPSGTVISESPTSDGGGGCNTVGSNSLGSVIFMITLSSLVLNGRRGKIKHCP